MIKSLEEFSQILALAGISSSEEERILAVVKNLSTSPKAIDEPEQHEPHPKDDWQNSTNFPCQEVDEIEDSCTTSDGEYPLELEIEDFLTCHSSDLQCTQETNYLKEEDLHVEAKEENTQNGLNEEKDLGYPDYIALWFQTITT